MHNHDLFTQDHPAKVEGLDVYFSLLYGDLPI